MPEKLTPEDVINAFKTESDADTLLDLSERVCDALMEGLELPEDGAASAEGAATLTAVIQKVNHRHMYFSRVKLAAIRRLREAGRAVNAIDQEKKEAISKLMADPEISKGKNKEAREGLAAIQLESVELSEFAGGSPGNDDAPKLIVELRLAQDRKDKWSDVEKFLGVVCDRLRVAKELAKQQVTLAMGSSGFDE